jgi:hypothetical protein
MNITTMQMSPTVARALYKDYRKKVREHRAERLKKANENVVEGGKIFRAGRIAKSLIEKEDETLMESYHAMAQGMRLINVSSVLHEAGLDKVKQLPVLALAGAHWKHCHLTWYAYYNTFQFSPESWGATTRHRDRELTDGCSEYPLRIFTANLQNQEWRKSHDLPQLPVKAVVPSIPAHLRPAGDLYGYHILFEAVWEHAPPVDPILLKHVHGHMYAVLAQWNLTDVERSVLEGRIS